MRKTIIVDDKSLHLVFGKTEEEWTEKYGAYFCWDIGIEELLDGTLEINEDIWYWIIDGRCYETKEEVIND